MSLNTFIPEVWTAEVQRQLEKYLVYGQVGIVNRNYEGEITGAGDTVKINGIGPVTVKSYTKNSDIADPDTLTDAQTSLLINQQDYFNFQIDDIDIAQQRPKVMAAAMEEASYAMRDGIDQYIASLYTDASASNLIGDDTTPKTPNNTAGSDENVYNLVVDCAVKLTDSKVPTEGRWMVVPPWFYGRLLKEDNFIDASKAGTTAGLRNGQVGMAAGFTILQSHNVPNTASAKYKVMFGTSRAITFANQIAKVEPYRVEKRFADAVKGLNVYGAKVIRPEALGVLTCNSS
ncbi:MAG: P22 phage major capsid protein family protein [Mesotoga sp.]|nr:P22 phage major capsid protein family protein [Mesotoga sp.]